MLNKDYKNAFEKDFKQWKQDPEFELKYKATKEYINLVDNIINELLEENKKLKEALREIAMERYEEECLRYE